MNCEQVQAMLTAYLDGEVTPSERVLIQTHLSDCTDCQQELTLLSAARDRVRSSLQRRAAHAVPSQDAWNRLEARLTEAAQPSSRFEAWFPRKAPSAGRASIRKIFGGITMRKKLLASALGMLAIVSIAAVLMARNVTSVSAQQILDRASAIQSVAAVSDGIQHIKVENYFLKDLTDSEGVKTILDSYGDLQNGNFWNVTFDANDAVLDVSAYDGVYTYSQDYNVKRGNGEPLTIYRTPQNKVNLKPVGSGDGLDEKAMFEQMRGDPNVQLAGKETWDDGREVYVLQSQQLVKAVSSGQVEQPQGLMTIYFDSSTYKQLGFRMTMQKDGGEILLASQKILVNEILPAGTSVPWNLDSLQGVVLVDDPNREHGDMLPEIITPDELAAKTTSGYLLENIPDGYTVELTAPPKQPVGEPYIYIASYRTEANDYFVIQVAGPADVQAMTKEADETYTTASGLVIHFMKDIIDSSSGKLYTEAIVEAPNGVAFMINSTLPRETVKAWAEELVLVK